MKSVFTIWHGEYSDATIDYVTEDAKKANKFVESWWSQNPYGGYDQPYIEEYLVDDWEIETVNESGYIYVYAVKNKQFMLTNTNKSLKPNVTVGVKLTPHDSRRPWNYADQVYVWLEKKDDEKALRIAQDAYAKERYKELEGELKFE